MKTSTQLALVCFWCALVSLCWGAGGASAVAETWEGESKCSVPGSPCHDEHVVYHIAADKDVPERFAIDAYKVVNGEQAFMGTLACAYHADRATLSCSGNTRMKDDWEFKVSGDSMTGTLTVGDEKTLYRRVQVRRK